MSFSINICSFQWCDFASEWFYRTRPRFSLVDQRLASCHFCCPNYGGRGGILPDA